LKALIGEEYRLSEPIMLGITAFKDSASDPLKLRSNIMSISLEALSKFIGQKIRDIYGREFGYLVHVFTEVDGTVTGVEIFKGSSFMTIDPMRLKVDGENNILILPEWRAEAMRILNLMDKVRKRQKALEELYGRQEIPKSTYDEMKRKLDSEMLKLKDEQARLKNKLKSKLSEIEEQLTEIDKVMVSMKMSYIAGEINDSAYKSSIELLKQSRESFIMERDDIKKTLDKLDILDKEGLELKPSGLSQQSQEVSNKNEQPKMELPSPIAIKVINTL
jgi:hypothetical protein